MNTERQTILEQSTYTRYWACRAQGMTPVVAWKKAAPCRAPRPSSEKVTETMRAYGRACADVGYRGGVKPISPVVDALRPAKPLPRAASRKASYATYHAKTADGADVVQKFYVPDGRKPDPAYGFNVTTLLTREVPVFGYVEYNGQRIADPAFEAASPVASRGPSAAQRLKAICKALNEGEIEAAMLLAAAEK